MPEPGAGAGDEPRPEAEGPPSRGDLRLIARAVRERWPIGEATRGRIVRELMDVIEDGNADPRRVMGAIKALLAADKLNLQQELIDLRRGDGGDMTVRMAAAEGRDAAYQRPGDGPADEGGPAERTPGPVP